MRFRMVPRRGRGLLALAGLIAAFLVLDNAAARAAEVSGTLRGFDPGPQISRYLYGHFLEHLGRAVYDGVWVGPDSPIPNRNGLRTDVVEALRALQIPVIRWPGGCYADEYHWRTGIGEPEDRPVTINMSWGGVEETNAFGTHEYFALLEATGADAYIAGNLGTGSAREMAEWLEYMTSPTRSTLAEERRANGRDDPYRVPFFGVGNESWGCGGQMTPEHYVNLYKQTAEFLQAPGQRLLKVASGGYDARTDWTEALSLIEENIDGISHHYYTTPTGVWARKGNATGFPEEQWISTLERALRVESHIAAQEALLAANDPDNSIGIYLDEWGTWYDPTPGASALWQQNTLRDAMVAALHFHVFHRHAARLRMANIAQTVNVLQAMILTEGERMLLTPTYHLFEMYIPFQDATFVPVELHDAPVYALGEYSVPAVSATAARAADGKYYVSLANLDPDEEAEVALGIEGVTLSVESAEILTAPAMDSYNSFDAPEQVMPRAFDGAAVSSATLHVSMPSKSILMIVLVQELGVALDSR